MEVQVFKQQEIPNLSEQDIEAGAAVVRGGWVVIRYGSTTCAIFAGMVRAGGGKPAFA